MLKNNGKKIMQRVTLILILLLAMNAIDVSAAVACSATCLTTAQISAETTNYQNGVAGSKCLFIYNNQVYEPPKGTISGGMHKNDHACGADVTGIMKSSHLNNPSLYLLPYVCAPLCQGPPPCPDSDSDGYTASSCGGNDCNDGNPQIHPGAAETCNNVDDNCNSQIDESLTQQQSCGAGACLRTITQTCSAGQFLPACAPGLPGTETCNNIDDNCNVQTDEGITSQQTCGVGACQVTITQSCNAGAFTPACTPGTPAPAEICSNSIDDNCNGQLNEGCSCTDGQTQACGSTIGACEAGTQTCASGAWGSCIGAITAVTEVCGNSIDDNCNSQIDEGCLTGTPTVPGGQTPTPITGASVTPNLSNGPTPTQDGNNPIPSIPAPSTCAPSCETLCGQDNGCGGTCPNSDINALGKCGNSACVPKCQGAECGQLDGCGGICPDFDSKTCGVCGNAQCCVPEICSDNLDNDCDGTIDNSCGMIDQFVISLSSKYETPQGGNGTMRRPSSLVLGLELLQKPPFQARIHGILAFFFAGLTLLIGIFRFQLIQNFSRKEVITYHTVVGFFSFFFLALHLVAVLSDAGGWAETIKLSDIFIPTFSGVVLFNTSLGVLGMYLLASTIASGVFFVKIAKKISYKNWLLIHRFSFLFYGVIFLHALWMGTDFKNPYILVFFSHVILVILGYMAIKAFGIKWISDIIGQVVRSFGGKTSNPIEDVLKNSDLIGKNVVVAGDIQDLPMQQTTKDWKLVYYGNFSILAFVPKEISAGRYSQIEGILKKDANQIYLQISKVKV